MDRARWFVNRLSMSNRSWQPVDPGYGDALDVAQLRSMAQYSNILWNYWCLHPDAALEPATDSPGTRIMARPNAFTDDFMRSLREEFCFEYFGSLSGAGPPPTKRSARSSRVVYRGNTMTPIGVFHGGSVLTLGPVKLRLSRAYGGTATPSVVLERVRGDRWVARMVNPDLAPRARWQRVAAALNHDFSQLRLFRLLSRMQRVRSATVFLFSLLVSSFTGAVFGAYTFRTGSDVPRWNPELPGLVMWWAVVFFLVYMLLLVTIGLHRLSRTLSEVGGRWFGLLPWAMLAAYVLTLVLLPNPIDNLSYLVVLPWFGAMLLGVLVESPEPWVEHAVAIEQSTVLVDGGR